MNSSKIYSIGEAARLCSVTAKQIRHWEEKKYLQESTRLICGERSYRNFGEDDLVMIKRIKYYLNAGYTLSTAAKKAKENYGRKGGNNNA